MNLSWDDRLLGMRLGLGDLGARVVCMGYQNGCVCADCLERQEHGREKPQEIRQPWEAA